MILWTRPLANSLLHLQTPSKDREAYEANSTPQSIAVAGLKRNKSDGFSGVRAMFEAQNASQDSHEPAKQSVMSYHTGSMGASGVRAIFEAQSAQKDNQEPTRRSSAGSSSIGARSIFQAQNEPPERSKRSSSGTPDTGSGVSMSLKDRMAALQGSDAEMVGVSFLCASVGARAAIPTV